MRATTLLLCAFLLAGCASSQMTARRAIDEFTAAGLEAPDPRDVTAQECERIGCLEAVATDVVTVYRWSDGTQAAAHAQDLDQPAYKLNELVIAFPRDTDVDTSAYANALTDALREAER